MALIGDPKLVIFDEPTTALDVTTQIEVLRAFKSVMRQGRMAGVYVSHDLAVVAQIADRIVVLKGGVIQEIGATAQILSAPEHPYTRELLAAFAPAGRVPAQPRRAGRGRTKAGAGAARSISAGYGKPRADGVPPILAVDKVSFRLERGRNLGIIGESGCGKSTLARCIAGIIPPSSGTICFDGKPMAARAQDRKPEELRKLQIVFQSADTALNPARSIEDILGRPLTFYHELAWRGARCPDRPSCSTWCVCPAR